MKLLSFKHKGAATYGLLDATGKTIAVPASFAAKYPDLKSVIAGNAYAEMQQAITQGGIATNAPDVQNMPVIPNPNKILCVGLNYKDHVVESKRTDAEYPSIFTRFADTLAAQGDALHKPGYSNRFDFEGELAIIIGKTGRNIAPENALDYIAGYACFNDGSIRDWQRHTHQWLPGKNFPMTGPLGPYMMTSDELGDVNRLHLETRLNGKVMQTAPLSDLIFTLPVIINYVSGFTELSAGDVIATGTPGGVGDRREPPVYMFEGDVVEVEITDLGILRNTIKTV